MSLYAFARDAGANVANRKNHVWRPPDRSDELMAG
jgi:hypothetical protein